MFFPCLHGFSEGFPASSHSQKKHAMWGKLGTLIVYVVIQTKMAANYPNSYSSQRYTQPQKTYKICLRSACLFTSMCVHLCVFKALCNLQSRCLQLHKNYHLEPLEHIKLVMHCIALCISQTKKGGRMNPKRDKLRTITTCLSGFFPAYLFRSR